MSMIIRYGGVDVFSGFAATPRFSRTVDPIIEGNRIGVLHSIQLQGEITGQCTNYAAVVQRQRQFLSGFRQDYQTLEVVSTSGIVLSYSYTELESINFEDSTYASDILPFTVSLRAYPEAYFSGTYGILSPVNDFSFSEDEEGIVTLNHRVSAVGFNTSAGNPSNALNNAKSWVQARTGWNSQVLPSFISGFDTGNMCLRELSENYNRLEATYEVNSTYQSDKYLSGQGILRYTLDIQSGIEDGITQVSIDGNIKGCKIANISVARGRYQSFDAFSTANNALNRFAGRSDLSSFPVSKSVSEDQKRNVLDFSYVYDDDRRPKIYIIYDLEFSFDSLADVIGCQVTATVGSRGQYTTSKWAEVQNAAGQINLYSIANIAYSAYAAEIAPHLSSFPLNPTPNSTSRTDDEYDTRVVLQASFDNRPLPPAGFKSYDYSITVSPGIRQIGGFPILDGEGSYYLFDKNYISRSNIQITLEAVGDTVSSEFVENFLKTEALKIQNIYLGGIKKVLEIQNLNASTASFDKARSLNCAYSSQNSEFTLS